MYFDNETCLIHLIECAEWVGLEPPISCPFGDARYQILRPSVHTQLL